MYTITAVGTVLKTVYLHPVCNTWSVSALPHWCRVPVKTVYQGLGKGIIAVAFSSDAKYLATISKGPAQVCMHSHTERGWEW